jgi:aminopeptidase N
MKRFLFACLLLIPGYCFCQVDPPVESGVSRALAVSRKSLVQNTHYTLYFDVPSGKTAPVSASELISFDLKSNAAPLQLDFMAEKSQVKLLKVNGQSKPIRLVNEHLLLEAGSLVKGSNTVQIEFTAGNAALNRNDDYLYTLFVPDRARTAFPCFDQPDLKAVFELKVAIPAAWMIIANGKLKDSVLNDDRKTCSFFPSDAISTYLFSFAAGKFKQDQGTAGRYPATFLYRETDAAKVKNSMDSIYKGHADALHFLEGWTSISFPFQKVGFVAIPDFQFGGMEHPGAVQYKSSTLFLDEGATKDQFIGRSNLISHETAHMWFGDLVSISWFNDVWMKEVFANFMADKVTEKLTGAEPFNLKFLTDHFPAAYGVDRTAGANPIRQDLENLNQAGSLYGNIIYHKAPIMMRQLESLMGQEKFQEGIREYLKQYAYGNASWPELIAILNKHSDVDLLNWNKVWVNEAGRPIFDYQISFKGNKISKLTISQTAEQGARKSWPEIFDLALVYPDHVQVLPIEIKGESLELKAATGLAKPSYLIFNASGAGYGVWPVDKQMIPVLYTLKSPVTRASSYIALYENMLNGRTIKPTALLNLFAEGLGKEQEELNLKLLSGYIGAVYWSYTKPEDRERMSLALEAKIWAAMFHQERTNNKKLLFKLYQDVFLNHAAYQKLAYVWKLRQAPAGIKLTEDDYTSLAFSLSLRKYGDSSILTQQLERITDPDRRRRFQFIMPAVSADPGIRDAFFNSLAEKKNREKESNVVSALYYLHHPLLQEQSVKYLKRSLGLLEEIQETGDIFFPQSWLQATFGYYQSPEALQIVKDFLAAHPDYNPRLKAKILQAADPVFRAQKLLLMP